MEKINYIIERKRKLASKLKEYLIDCKGIRLPAEPKWGGHIYQSFVILVDENINRDGIINYLASKDIETTLGTYALHDQPYYQNRYGYKAEQLNNSHNAFFKAITLPLYPQMNDNDLLIIKNELNIAIIKGK